MHRLTFESVLGRIISVPGFILFSLFTFILKKIPQYLTNIVYLLNRNCVNKQKKAMTNPLFPSVLNLEFSIFSEKDKIFSNYISYVVVDTDGLR